MNCPGHLMWWCLGAHDSTYQCGLGFVWITDNGLMQLSRMDAADNMDRAPRLHRLDGLSGASDPLRARMALDSASGQCTWHDWLDSSASNNYPSQVKCACMSGAGAVEMLLIGFVL